jgi:hypothetical protein
LTTEKGNTHISATKIARKKGIDFSILKYSVKEKANLFVVRNIIIIPVAVIRQNSIPKFYRFETPCFLGWFLFGPLKAFCTFCS